MSAFLPDGVAELIPEHLGMQRWYSGEEAPKADAVQLRACSQLWEEDSGVRRLWHAIVAAGADHYQLLLGERPSGEPADFLHGHEEAVLGAVGDAYFYDATLDSDLAKVLLSIVSEGSQPATLARPLSADQSNTSLVFDDRIILKLFRRLHAGPNPEVEVTGALASAGFEHVATPLITWRQEDFDLAFGQEFLAGGSDGWALAVTSLRDLYTGESDRPEDAGGDFAAEAERLGLMTANMHLALGDVFGVERAADPDGADGSELATDPDAVRRLRARVEWADLVEGLGTRLARAGRVAGTDLGRTAIPLLERIRAVRDPGPCLRVHGDYHLGQVMRTDTGWFVLDFEGEPGRPLQQRRARSSPLKDITGMLRSFHYAARHVLAEHRKNDWEGLEPLARAWETHNRRAFLDGYQERAGIADLLPAPNSAQSVFAAYELDKALYELDYEVAHRPDWVPIPLDALERLVSSGDSSEQRGE